MKKLHIIGILVIAVAIGLIFSFSGSEVSSYADFTKAMLHPSDEFHVVGKLDKDEPQVYEPRVNADRFYFSMTDKAGITKHVVLHKSKPQDFEKSEQIVLIGKMQGSEFHANDILMKCPSKYENGKPEVN